MILICGIPNSGKTTYSSKYEEVIHYDDIKGSLKKNKILEIVKNNNFSIVEGTYELSKDREKLVKSSKEKNICIWLNTELNTCLEREKSYRKRPEQITLWSFEKFEPPTYEEGWDKIIVIKNNKAIEVIHE